MLEDEIEEDEDGTSGGEFVEGVFEGEVGEGAAGEVFEEGTTPMLAPPLVRCRSSVIPKTDIEKSTESSLLQYLTVPEASMPKTVTLAVFDVSESADQDTLGTEVATVGDVI
mmetsp:Transcript_44215/g.94191  ORF Transcript_44215/g.94191 Transcript_44215/m.94191 type:complete len:112 (+) Transcript_44215:229-564(+)